MNGPGLTGLRRAGRRWPLWLGLGLGLAGGWMVVDAATIHAKAWVGQTMLERAWARTLDGDTAARPWPWADTWPVARIDSPDHDETLIVLSGATGPTLAWGPGWLHGTAQPGQPGLSVIGGHRDTHFRFLEAVEVGDGFAVTGADGATRHYRVAGTEVVDHRTASLTADPVHSTITLVTCWPFDAVTPNGPLRYLVHLVPTDPGQAGGRVSG